MPVGHSACAAGQPSHHAQGSPNSFVASARSGLFVCHCLNLKVLMHDILQSQGKAKAAMGRKVMQTQGIDGVR